MKKIFILIMAIFFCLSSVNAQENIASQLENKLNSLKKLNQGKSFKSNRSSYVFLPDVFPRLKSETAKRASVSSYNSPSSVDSTSNQENSNIIGELGQYNFVIENPDQEAGLNTLSSEQESLFPAAYNSKTGNVVLVTGVIKARLNSMESVDQIASQFNLGIKERFDHIRFVYFSCSTDQDIIQLAEKINQRNDVEMAEVQVIEYLQKAY